MISPTTIFYALLGGVLPALFWLWFWLREDKLHPEPRRLIRKTFMLGMLSVIVVLPIQKGVELLLPGSIFAAIILWAFFEEILKFFAGYFGGLHSKADNEPVDPIIYMITAALGFVALENALFILGPLVSADIPRSIVTGNLRFIGASLLHVVSSGLIGVAISFTFYKPWVKAVTGAWAFVAAVLFHALFNLFIINFKTWGTPVSFIMVWLGVIFLLWAFEKAKSIVIPRM